MSLQSVWGGGHGWGAPCVSLFRVRVRREYPEDGWVRHPQQQEPPAWGCCPEGTQQGLSEGFGEVCPRLQGPPQGRVQDWIVGRGGDPSGAGAWPGWASRRTTEGVSLGFQPRSLGLA